MEYLTFDIEIGQGETQYYPVRVLSSPAGEARSSMYLPLDEHLQLLLAGMKQAIHHLSKVRSQQPYLPSPDADSINRSLPSPDEQTVRELGTYLFDALFANEIRSRYDVSQQIAEHQTKGLRIRLRIHDALMSTLPWEFLHDARSHRSICLSNTTPIVRYLDLPQTIPSLNIKPPLHVLGMIANPKEQEQLDVRREKQLMHDALQPLETAGLVKLTWIEGQSWQALQQAFLRGTWHVFHFIGHASYNEQQKGGVLSLVDEDGYAFYLPAAKLGNILMDHSSLRFVFLNACESARSGTHDIYSGIAQTLMQQGIPAILSMHYEISDKASIQLAQTFYRALAYGIPVDAAVNEARKAVDIAMTQTLQWGTPILYMRSPDGVLFDTESKDIQFEPVAAYKEQPQLHVTGSTRGFTPTEQKIYKQGDLICQYDLHANWVSAVAWSPDGTRIASSGGDATVRIWNPINGDTLVTYHGQAGKLSEVLAVAWSPDSTRIASGGNRATIQVWNASNKQLLASYSGHSPKLANVLFLAHVFWAAWSPDGKSIASTCINLGFDKAVHIWNAATGKLIRKFDLHSSPIDTSSAGGVAWSPDGIRIAAAMQGEVRIYNVTTGSQLLMYKQQHGYIPAIAWSPDGERIASMDSDSVQVWNATTGEFYYAYQGHTNSLRDVAWSPDARYLATSSNDRTVQIWTAESGTRIFTYTGHLDDVGAISWAPDSRRIASASKDKTVHIWQAIQT